MHSNHKSFYHNEYCRTIVFMSPADSFLVSRLGLRKPVPTGYLRHIAHSSYTFLAQYVKKRGAVRSAPLH